MKILYLTQRLPFPVDSGGPIKTYETLKLLAKKHTLFLVCFAPQKQDLIYKENLEKVCRKVKVVVSHIPFDHFNKIRRVIIRSFFSLDPLITFRYRDKRFQRAVEQILQNEEIEAIHVDHLNLAFYLPREKRQLWVLEEHNVESVLNWQIVQKERFNKFKFFSFLEAIKLMVFQRKMMKRFDYCLAISQPDGQKLVGLGAKKSRVFFLPTPFETKNLFSFEEKKPVILFVGLLSWWPNKDGFWWFYRQIFPLIKREITKAEFWVIGKEAFGKMANASKKNPSLKLLGYVKELRGYLEKASIFVVPLRSGSGVRMKILTSLASGLPVVSTTIGAEGIEAKSGKEILIADSPKEFARASVRILKDRKLAGKLSQNGIKFIKKHYNQNQAQKVLDKIYN